MRLQHWILAGLVGAALSACATAPTVYGPAAGPDSAGYRETRIETDRYRVTFKANPDLDLSAVEDLALRRAAELTLSSGADWFRVVTRSTDRSGEAGGGTSIGIGGSSGSYGSGVGVGIGFDLSPDRRKYETTLEILLGRGEKPNEARVYDARSILSQSPVKSVAGQP